VESAAVYLGQFANDVTCAAFLARLKMEGLEGLDTAAGQSSEGVLHGEMRLGATLQPTLERLGAAEKLAMEFAALLPPDQVPLPWLRALVAKTFLEMERDAEPGYPDPWKNVLRRLFSLRLIQATDEVDADGQPRVVRVHRLVQELVLRENVTEKETKARLLSSITDIACLRSVFLQENWQDRNTWWELTPLLTVSEKLIEQNRPRSIECAERVVFCLIELAQITEGIRLGRAALEESERVLGPEHSTSVDLINKLAILYHNKGDYPEAEGFYRKALDITERTLGPDDPTTLQTVHNFATFLGAKGDYFKAKPLRQRAFEGRERVLGPDHIDTLSSAMALAYLYFRTGDYEDSEALYKRALQGYKRVLGEDDIETIKCLHNYSMLVAGKGDYEEAARMANRVVSFLDRTLPADHPDLLITKQDLAVYLAQANKKLEAEKLLMEVIERYEQKLGFDHPDTLRAFGNYAWLLALVGRIDESVTIQKRVLEANERKLGPEHPDLLRSWNNHCVALRRQGRADLAEPIDLRVAATTAKILGDIHPLTIHRRNNLVLTLILLGKLEEARQILAANWRLNAPPHANTTPRIAFLRHLIALLESQSNTPFLGQLKTLLTGPELPVASDVAVPWDIAYFIEFLKPKLGQHNSEFLTALVAAMNDRGKLPALDPFPEWHDQPHLPLDIPWPDPHSPGT
jgi:tetratricopeptide (TPR) repeat protein